MDHDKRVNLRVPKRLWDALEAERTRMSRAAGAEVKVSAVVRSVLERGLKLMPLCPVCGTQLFRPKIPKYRTVGPKGARWKQLIVLCSGCPTQCEIDEEYMVVSSFKARRRGA